MTCEFLIITMILVIVSAFIVGLLQLAGRGVDAKNFLHRYYGAVNMELEHNNMEPSKQFSLIHADVGKFLADLHGG